MTSCEFKRKRFNTTLFIHPFTRFNTAKLPPSLTPQPRWILGTWAVVKGMEGNVCPATNPVLYSFSLFLVVAYWLGFLFGAIALVGTLFGKQIKSKAQASLEKVRSVDDPQAI